MFSISARWISREKLSIRHRRNQQNPQIITYPTMCSVCARPIPREKHSLNSTQMKPHKSQLIWSDPWTHHSRVRNVMIWPMWWSVINDHSLGGCRREWMDPRLSSLHLMIVVYGHLLLWLSGSSLLVTSAWLTLRYPHGPILPYPSCDWCKLVFSSVIHMIASLLLFLPFSTLSSFSMAISLRYCIGNLSASGYGDDVVLGLQSVSRLLLLEVNLAAIIHHCLSLFLLPIHAIWVCFGGHEFNRLPLSGQFSTVDTLAILFALLLISE